MLDFVRLNGFEFVCIRLDEFNEELGKLFFVVGFFFFEQLHQHCHKTIHASCLFKNNRNTNFNVCKTNVMLN